MNKNVHLLILAKQLDDDKECFDMINNKDNGTIKNPYDLDKLIYFPQDIIGKYVRKEKLYKITGVIHDSLQLEEVK